MRFSGDKVVYYKAMEATTTSLRIGIFMDDFFPNSGGVARSIELQINELVAMGHTVTLFAPKTGFIPPENCASKALPVWRIPGTESYLCSLKFSKKLAAQITDDYKFDVIHSQNERGAMFLASQISQLQNIPHIHTFHSSYAGTHRTSPFMSAVNSLTYMQLAPIIMHRLRGNRERIKIYFPRKLTTTENSRFARSDWKNIARLARYTDAFTSPAQFMIDSMVDASRGQLADRAHVVPNGISKIFARAERIRPVEPVVRFLSCGRLDPEKRVDVIIKAFAQLNHDDAELYLVGRGASEDDLKRLVEKEVKRGKVLFLGHYNDIERIANEFANSDVFVFASYHFDTQGMVLAEAAAAGTPILYCDERLQIGVTPENSLLVHHSVSAIADGMRELVHNPEQRQAMAVASKKVGAKLTSTAMEEKFTRIYRHTLTKPPLV